LLNDSSPIVGVAGVAPNLWPVVVDEAAHRAFVGGVNDGTVSVIDTRTGALLRSTKVGGYSYIAVAPRARRVAVSSSDGAVYLLDARTGAVLVRIPYLVVPRNPPDIQLVVDNSTDHLFVGFGANRVDMLDVRTGALLHHIGGCPGAIPMAVDAHTHHVFVTCDDSTIMVDSLTGTVLQRINATIGDQGLMIVDDATGRVFVIGIAVPSLVLDLATGGLVRRLPFCGNRPEVDQITGRVFVVPTPCTPIGTYTPPLPREVLVLDGHSGAVLRHIRTDPTPAMPLFDGATGHLLVDCVGPVDSNGVPKGLGVLDVLDGATGQLLRTTPLGWAPSDMVLDRDLHHLVVSNTATDLTFGPLTASLPDPWWQGFKRATLQKINHAIPWLGVHPPPPPPTTTQGSVLTLDLGRL
jgi:DNA-binding beta-propeller fold protein YncE